MVPVEESSQEEIAGNSQKDVKFAPHNMMDDDLGSRARIISSECLIWYPAEIDVSIRPGWFYHEKEDSLVKTPRKLIDIYYNSVGKNGVLLLNIPPNKQGLICKNDVASLVEWNRLRKNIFKKNLLKRARISCSNGVNVAHLTDNCYNTWWTTLGKDTTATIDIELDKEKDLNLVSLQENIRIGQRIEKFSIVCCDNNGKWIKIAEGTTVGYKRILRFPTVRTRKVRIIIESSRLNPTFSELGLYRDFGNKYILDNKKFTHGKQ